MPLVDGWPQPLCARWSGEDLASAALAYRSGERSLRQLPDRSRAVLVGAEAWGSQVAAFADPDTPDAWRALFGAGGHDLPSR